MNYSATTGSTPGERTPLIHPTLRQPQPSRSRPPPPQPTSATTTRRVDGPQKSRNRTNSSLLGWFRRIGRGWKHCCQKIVYHNSNHSCCFIRCNNTCNKANSVCSPTNNPLFVVGTDTCIEINNNDDEYYYYFEDEFLDDDLKNDKNDDNDIADLCDGRLGFLRRNLRKDDTTTKDNNKSAFLLSLFRRRDNYCTYGTSETSSGVWYNANDTVGTIMSCSVWILIGYSAWTMMLLGQSQHISTIYVAMYWTICTLALSCHVKTTVTDPGAIPKHAIPPLLSAPISNHPNQHLICTSCQSYKPKLAHHCRICNRCVARMDHHCPWMNNCVGANNMKFFILFLLYVWIGCAMALLIFAINYFACTNETCEFGVIEIQLVRLMTLLCIGTIVFVSSMILNVMYGIITGVGTIDRMQKKIYRTWSIADEEPIELIDIFGIDPYIYWLLPVNPTFPDYERIMGYSTRQRQQRINSNKSNNNNTILRQAMQPQQHPDPDASDFFNNRPTSNNDTKNNVYYPPYDMNRTSPVGDGDGFYGNPKMMPPPSQQQPPRKDQDRMRMESRNMHHGEYYQQKQQRQQLAAATTSGYRDHYGMDAATVSSRGRYHDSKNNISKNDTYDEFGMLDSNDDDDFDGGGGATKAATPRQYSYRSRAGVGMLPSPTVGRRIDSTASGRPTTTRMSETPQIEL